MDSMMDLKLNGKVALVTGAGSQVGFGKGISLALAKYGCDVVVADIDMAGVEKTAAAVAALGRGSLAIKADVTNIAEVKNMVDQGTAKFGKIDILINNAGRTTSPLPFVNTPEKNWEIVFNLCVFGVFHCSKAVLPQMIARKYGKIINISSGAGFSGSPMFIHYGAAKAAVMTFTRGLAREVISSGINVNCVAPGFGETNFLATAGFPDSEKGKAMATIPTGRSTTPEEIGNMVAYLSSDLAKQIVGQVYAVDGGHSMH
jgi:NAD(P)-dependent dehydrogenase (short-subunit alcohol dehydrogenase family)